MMLFADIILPLPIPQLYTYLIPRDLHEKCKQGRRVVVPFGKKKLYSAIVRKTHNIQPLGYEIKEIITVIDENPIVAEINFKFWEWLADYYMCPLGDIYKAALPMGLKLESETFIYFNPEFTEYLTLNVFERNIYEYLKKNKSVKIDEIYQFIEKKIAIKSLNSLLDKKAVLIEEKIRDKNKPKKEKFVCLAERINTEQTLKAVFDELEKSPKQIELLTKFAALCNLDFESPQGRQYEISKTELLNNVSVSASVLDSLIKKDVFFIKEKDFNIRRAHPEEVYEIKTLSEAQTDALVQIQNHFAQNKNVLLFGITSSGKTEVFIHLIKEYIEKGYQVLYLLPEIAITTQIINRLKKIFGEHVGVYHSKFSDMHRTEIWKNISNPKKSNYQIILGVRSSIFLPFSNLGLIIVDEEHENSYKQYDPSPRYNARDAAVVLGSFYKAKVLLATATPSFETYFNCLADKYKLVELRQRYKNVQLPQTFIVDTKELTRKKLMKSIFSPLLLENIKTALLQNEQVILFQNRRGFAPYLECRSCAWIPKCENCDVSLTYHKKTNDLICHYCGYKLNTPKTCLACGDATLQTKGFGTQKIEDEIKIFFPDAKVERMDYDTTRSKSNYEQIINDFEQHNIDVLVGTQMISKGLDFQNVSVVGIMNADTLLNFPDFRAYEHSYQMLVQVSGRAGRKDKRGKVIIQTSAPENNIFKYIMENDYYGLVKNQFIERKNFKYPPYYKLIKISIKHKELAKTDKAADILATYLKSVFDKRVLGPEYPLISRIQNLFIKEILIKIEKQKPHSAAREIIVTACSRLKAEPEFSSIFISINVDPI